MMAHYRPSSQTPSSNVPMPSFKRSRRFLLQQRTARMPLIQNIGDALVAHLLVGLTAPELHSIGMAGVAVAVSIGRSPAASEAFETRNPIDRARDAFRPCDGGGVGGHTTFEE
mmetsp:Transcript_140709/g.392185  ORF Transcript_140709/g.392185 Transcript_140709/m.392185 type:complete len:113 (+) Transcript_140709:142-480(+)